MQAKQIQKSYYFHTNDDINNDQDPIFQNRDVILADILKQMQKNHRQVLQKLDESSKLKELQIKLSGVINDKFKELADMIGRLEPKVAAKPVQNPDNENKSPLPTQKSNERTDTYARFLAGTHEEDLQKDYSRMINLYGYEIEPAPEQFSEMIVLHRNASTWDEGDNFDLQDPSNILGQFSNIFQEMNLKITECAKIYDYPEMSTINFHNVIDKKDNILFLAQLENNQIVGAFTHLCFNPQPNYIPRENSKSFLCNLTRRHFAFAARVNKTHTHDENYLIFGNWQIKVKWREDVLETNWGTNGDCFQLKKYGGSQRLTINTCEFFGKGAQQKKLRMKRYNIYTFS